MDHTNSNKTISIVLIDSHKLFREGLRSILGHDSTIGIVAEGTTKADALKLTKEFRPTILLIDIKVIEKNSLVEMKKIVRQSPYTKVIILAEQNDENYMLEALKVGASGYMLKEMNADAFIEAIKAVNSGIYWYHPHVTHHLIEKYYLLIREVFSNVDETVEAPRRPVTLFTRREYDVLKLLAKGHSNKVIAEQLHITSYTVSSHVRSILKKCDANDRTHAVIIAIENGWVSVPRI